MAAPADAHKLVLRGGATAAFGYVIRFGARLLFLLLVARLFGAALFGAYTLGVAAVELAAAGAGLGMKRYLFHLIEERDPERPPVHVVLDAFLLVAAAGGVLALGLAGAVQLLPAGAIAPDTALALVVLAPIVAVQALIDLSLAATRWTRKMRHEVAARSLVEPYVGIAAAAAAYAAGFDRSGLLISYWAGSLAALAYAVFGARACYGGFAIKSYARPPGGYVALARRTMLPAFTDLISALFARLDLYLVGMLLGEAPAGIYGMARQIRTPVRQVRQSFDFMLTPLLARTLSARGAREAGFAAASAGRLILAIQLPILIGLAVIGQPLLAWLGPEFADAYWPLILLGLAEAMLGAFGVGELILLYRRPALGLWVIGASIAANTVAALLLVDKLGLDGAALAVLIAVAAGAMIRRVMLARCFGIVIPFTYGAGPVVAAVSAVAAVLLADTLLNLPALGAAGVGLAVGFGVYAAALAGWMRVSGQPLGLVNLEAE